MQLRRKGVQLRYLTENARLLPFWASFNIFSFTGNRLKSSLINARLWAWQISGQAEVCRLPCGDNAHKVNGVAGNRYISDHTPLSFLACFMKLLGG
jgi:hypothetical protein